MDAFSAKIKVLTEEINQLGDNSKANEIEDVAKRLEGLNYSPPVVTPLAKFLRLDKQGLLVEVKRILALPDAEACALAPDDTKKCEDLRLQYITVLIFYFKKLIALRDGDPEEWDEIDELYVHD